MHVHRISHQHLFILIHLRRVQNVLFGVYDILEVLVNDLHKDRLRDYVIYCESC